DFQVVVAAEVDYVGHLPGYYSVSEGECEAVILSEDDAANAAAAGVRVMPTYGLASANFTQKRIAEGPFTEDEEAALAAEEARTYSVQALNLKRLRAAGVQFVVGTDLFPGRVLEEPKRWIELGALTPKEALIAMFATGPTLFPGRSIGCLDAGCEADFLVLDGNPLEDLDAFSSIRFHIKSGTMLGVEPG
ncbi:MAG: amidohydrolase family protein, partial [Pseudomonadota bacterium]